MCGLIGAVVAETVEAERRVNAGLAALRHRGPDHQEARVFQLAGKNVWLGHARLSIIDLASEADQPMLTEDGRYALIFNGEIYNYIELREELCAQGIVFRTSSDTEVLLHAWARWGESCLSRLDGIFAFAVLDLCDATLTCVRDPFGIKPFFYFLQDGAFYFASEQPALVKVLPAMPGPDWQRGYDYLVHGDYDSSERTFVEGVRHLMPAHVLQLDVGTGAIRSMRRWWSPDIEQISTLSFDDAAEAVREQFLQNIRLQLRSDVPLGAALSGGIDSSAVVCAIRHIEPEIPIHTFSFVASDTAISEEHWIDLVNERVDAIAHKVHADAADLTRDVDDVVHAQGEPFGSTSIYAQYRVFKLARESGITVTLDGQGADELLAGYSGYPGFRVLSHLSQGRSIAAWRFAHAWRQWPGRSYKLLAGEVARSAFPDALYDRVRALAGRDATPAWLDEVRLRAEGIRLSDLRPPDGRAPAGRKVVHHLRSSLQFRGLPSLLRHGDRNSMHFSIESRVPFLTTSLCDLLYSLPESYLVSERGETKSVFRAAMRGIVPDAILDRKDKIGFATPERAWFKSITPVLQGWLKDARTVPILKSDEAVRTLDHVMSGKIPFSWQLWRLVNYVRWWRLMYEGSAASRANEAPAVDPRRVARARA